MGQRRHLFALMTVGLFLLPGCTTQDNVPEASGTGEKIADSTVAVFEQTLEEPGISDFVREVLERAVDSGSISAEDYEEAFSRYEKCVADLGYTDTWEKSPDGLYVITPPPLEGQEAVDRYGELTAECADGTVMRIEALYSMQQNNPGLLADSREVAISCLRSLGAVPASFTTDDFEALWEPGFDDASFDIADPEVVGCLQSSGYAVAIG